MQAKIVNQGGFGRLLGGFSTEEGVYGQLFDGIATVGNDAVCGILGSHFLPTMSKNHHCPQEYLAPNTFDSFKNLCECLRCKPELQNCIKSAALTIPLGVPGVTDYTVSLGQCCNLDLVSVSHRTVLYVFVNFLRLNDFYQIFSYRVKDKMVSKWETACWCWIFQEIQMHWPMHWATVQQTKLMIYCARWLDQIS